MNVCLCYVFLYKGMLLWYSFMGSFVVYTKWKRAVRIRADRRFAFLRLYREKE